MLRTLAKLGRKKDGAAAIEFAIVAPVFFLLIFGIIEFSLIMFVSSIIEGGTATAARLSKTGLDVSTNPDPAARAAEDLARIRQVILDKGWNIVTGENLNVVILPTGGSPPNTSGGSGETVIYQSTYRWQLQTPMIASIIAPDDGTLTLTSTTVVVNEPFQ